MQFLLCTALLLSAQGTGSPLRFEVTADGQKVVARLPAEVAARLPAGPLTQEQGEAVLTLALLADKTNLPGPSMLGKYVRSGNELTFTPRLRLSAGATYRASLKAAGRTTSLDHRMPMPKALAPPRVLEIYPTADVLPANHLRFYIHFDRPMRGGRELFQHLAILDDKGKEIEEPWLVDEIWDEANNCLVLYIHPGRIKWGVELRESMGPVLHEKRSYTLVVRGEWTDLEGNKIGKDTIKRFGTTPEDRSRIELGEWKLTAPAAGTRGPLVLSLSRSIDYRSLQTGLTVLNARNEVLAGAITIGKDEKSWSFVPARPWQVGPHNVSVSPDLEDVAGNTPSRPFDMNLLTPRPPAQKLDLAFEPRLQHSDAPGEGPEKARLDNWHHWRGPLANGTAPKADPPVTWDKNTNIQWKAAIPGRGSATPIVWGDQVFVVTAIQTDRIAAPADLPKVDPTLQRKTTPPNTYYQFVVLSFDRNTGKLRWRRQAAEMVPHEGHHPSHSYAAGSPTTDGKFLYVSFGSFGIYCYDLDGTLQWHRDLGRMITRLGWGEAVTPVIHGNRLLLNWDQEKGSALICLDAQTGKTLWKAPRDQVTSWNTPLVVEHKGRTQVIVNGTNGACGHDLETGKEIWQCGPMTTNAIPSPVAADGIAYCMSGYGKFVAVAVPLDSVGDVSAEDRLAWTYRKGTPYVPSPLLLNDRLIFTEANGARLTILDRKTGRAILDRERLPGVQSFYASPAAAAGRIYLVDRRGMTLVLKQSDKLEVLAINELGEGVDASPVLVGRQLFLRGEKTLYCIAESVKAAPSR
jgi:outer membrane protein assembly factor BamB